MNIAGIICEYNPMHSGHAYHIAETRRQGADAVVCCLSGNYVQRGEPAFLDKWSRAETAVLNGADLVLEMPTPWVLQSAGNYAQAGVFILSSIGCGLLSFGVEDLNEALLEKVSLFCDDEESTAKVKERMKNGKTFPAALSEAAFECLGSEASDFLSKPNNILAVEYVRAVRSSSKKMNVLPVERRGEGHSSLELSSEHISSTAIRISKELESVSAFLADGTEEAIRSAVLKNAFPAELKTAEKAILSELSMMSKSEMSSFSLKEETANRLYNSLKNAKSLRELIDATKNKSITEASVRRLILRCFLKIPSDFSMLRPPYIHVLAANKTGIEILRSASAFSKTPIITKHSEAERLDEFGKIVYNLECGATTKYGAFTPLFAFNGAEQLHSVIRL